MVSMKRCKVCKDWRKEKRPTTEGVILGLCPSKKLKGYYHDTPRDGIDAWACGFDVDIMTGENFGCVNCRVR